MINDIIFNLMVAVVVAIIGAIANELLPYIKKKKVEAEVQIRQTRWAWVVDIVDAAVRAVEQTVAGHLHGQDKKDAAKRYIRDILDKNGIRLDDGQIDTLIEAAVRAMNQETMEPVLCTVGEAEGTGQKIDFLQGGDADGVQGD